MWLLKKHPPSISSDVLIYYLLQGRKYVVGRKDCDIVLVGDASISRKHATVSIIQKDKKSYVSIVDTSKIGVQVNGNTITSQTDTPLNSGDVLSFGKLQSKFRLEYYDLSVVMSCINNARTKTKIKTLVEKLGGVVKSAWDAETTHLVMEKLTFTIKVVCALACGKSVVTMKFFEDLLDCCDQKKGHKLPDVDNYLPLVAEQSLHNQEHLFQSNMRRKTLLDGKVFVSLFAKQEKRMKQAVELAGGKMVLKDIKESKLTDQLNSKQLIVLQIETKDEATLSNTQKTWMKEVYSKVTRNNLRLIRESEVGLAILHASIEIYCNPTTEKAPQLNGGGSHSQVLTDTMTDTQQSQQNVISPSDINKDNEGKRKRLETQPSPSEEEDEIVFKKPKLLSSTVKNIKSTMEQQMVIPDSPKTFRSSNKEDIIEIEDDVLGKEFIFNAVTTAQRFISSTGSIGKVKATEATEQNTLSNSNCKATVIQDKPRCNDSLIEYEGNCITERNKNKNITAEIDIFQHETEELEKSLNIITPKPNLLSTPQSKKPVPDTYPSTGRKFFEDDDDYDPFSFDIPESESFPNVTNVVQDIISDSHGASLASLPIGNNVENSKFLTAVASSQESNSENIVISDDEGEFICKNALCNNIDGISPANIADEKPGNEILKQSEYKSTKQSKHDMSDLLDNDEELMSCVSEEYLPIIEGVKDFVKLEGFLTTVNKKSTVTNASDDDPDLIGIDRDLVKTEFVKLISNITSIKRTSRQPVKNVKNFKCFKKQYYIGKEKPRRILIGRNDLVIFDSTDEEKSYMLDGLREDNNREEEEERRMDEMFTFGESKFTRSRR